MKSSAKKFILNWEYYSSFTKLTRHFAWIIKLLKKLLNWKRGHSSKEDFNCLKFKIIQDSRALLFNLDQHESYMKKFFHFQVNKHWIKAARYYRSHYA